MKTSTKDPTSRRVTREQLWPRLCSRYVKGLWILLLLGTITLSVCGGSSSGGSSQTPLTLSGNWQFTMAPPADGSYLGGLQGGFLLQQKGSATGALVYSVAVPPNTVCNSGSAAVTGTLNGQTVNLTAVAGTQTFTLTGILDFDGTTLSGTYASTNGTASDGSACGTQQTGLQWTASLVPPLTGSIQGSFLSTGGSAGLQEQEFLVTGSFTQAANTGAASANVTGTLNFLNAITNLSDYPCFTLANVTGQISGTSVSLQIIGSDGSNIGEIGPSAGSGLQAVTFNSTQSGYAVQSLAGTGYAVYANGCGGGSLGSPADSGNICLGVNSTTVCQQPITLTPSALIFSSQALNSTPTMQTITLANTYGSSLGGLMLTLVNGSGAGNFTETDNCGVGGTASQGEPFTLSSKQACVVTIGFSPLENCAGGTEDQCPTATLTVTSPNNDATFSVPITGGVSDGASAAKLNFGAARSSDHTLPRMEHHADID